MNENSYNLNSPYHKLNFVASTKNIPIHSQRNVLPKQYAVDLGILKGDFVKGSRRREDTYPEGLGGDKMNLNLTIRYNKEIKSLLQPVKIWDHSLVTSGDDALQ